MYGIAQANPRSGAWVGSAHAPVWACGGHDEPIRLDPAESRVNTLHLEAPTAVDGITGEPIGSLDGVKRLLLEASTCPGEVGCRLDPSQSTSNVFRVVLPTDR